MKTYDLILADPPWHFRNYSADAPGMMHNRSRGANKHYPTATTDDICRMIPPASKDAVLFMWACWPTLPDALKVIEAWGFEYKTLAWVWVKAKKSGFGFFTGMGYYTRSNSEPCLLATKGNGLRKPIDRAVQSLIYSVPMAKWLHRLHPRPSPIVPAVMYCPLREHSRKPDEQYTKINRLYPNTTRLEMFARRQRPGWDVFGNQVENSILVPMGDSQAG